MQTIECKCGNSYIILDPSTSTLTCGVVGMVGFKNVHVFNGIVTCAERNCGNEIFRQTKGN